MPQRVLIALALVALYFIWGSTFLGMRFAIESFPPFMMAAIRFVTAGALLYGWLRWRGIAAPSPQEWLGATVVGTLLLAAASWALGSLWGKHLAMPKGAMASAAQMLAGGAVLVVISLLAQEPWPAHVSAKSLYAIAYLIVFGSLIAYSAYLFLLQHVRPALATSYAFVNPLVAMLLGAALAGEHIDRAEYMALAIIIVGVLLVLPFERRT